MGPHGSPTRARMVTKTLERVTCGGDFTSEGDGSLNHPHRFSAVRPRVPRALKPLSSPFVNTSYICLTNGR